MRSLRARSLRALLVAVSFGVAALASAQVAAPTSGMSSATQRFVVTAMTEANFIDEASNTALANGARQPLQNFARVAIIDQRNAHRHFSRWVSPIPPGRAAPAEQNPLGFLMAPLAAAVPPGSGAPLAATNSGRAVTAEQKARLDEMQALSGADFDRAYLASQRDAYQTLRTEYETYARSGDDAALRAVASQDLPTIRRRINWLKVL